MVHGYSQKFSQRRVANPKKAPLGKKAAYIEKQVGKSPPHGKKMFPTKRKKMQKKPPHSA